MLVTFGGTGLKSQTKPAAQAAPADSRKQLLSNNKADQLASAFEKLSRRQLQIVKLDQDHHVLTLLRPAASENLCCRSGSGVTIAHHAILSKIGLSMQKTKVSTATRERLLRAARKVMKNAYAPFSNFRVGAAILTSKGQVFVGCNVENSSYGMTNCAERTAIFSAIAKSGPELEIRAVAVANDRGVPCSPCGACRQVIYEFGPRAIVFYEGKKGPKQSLITDLLPEGFRLK